MKKHNQPVRFKDLEDSINNLEKEVLEYFSSVSKFMEAVIFQHNDDEYIIYNVLEEDNLESFYDDMIRTLEVVTRSLFILLSNIDQIDLNRENINIINRDTEKIKAKTKLLKNLITALGNIYAIEFGENTNEETNVSKVIN